MPTDIQSVHAARKSWRWLILAGLLVALPSVPAQAQHGLFQQRAVGGISIDADGVVHSVTAENVQSLQQRLLKDVKSAAPELNAPVELRKVSLKGLEDAVAALIQKEGLLGKAGCSLPRITDNNHVISNIAWLVPKKVSTQCSFIKRNREYVVTASGGVQIDSFAVVDRVQVEDSITSIRERSINRAANRPWWWN